VTLLFVSIGREINLYGSGRILLDLLGLLKKQDFEVRAVVSSEIASLIPVHIKTLVIPGRKNVFGSLKGLLCLLFFSLKMRFDVVHFNFPPVSWEWFPLILLFKISKSKMICTFHGGILLEKRASGLQQILFRLYCQHIFHRIVVNSRCSRKLLTDYVPLKDRLVEIPHGIHFSHFQVKAKEKLPGNPALLYVGRLEHIKGVDLLIDMLPHVLEKCPNAQLHILGSGSQKKELVQRLSKHNLRGKVNFFGYVSGNALPRFYQMADICVFPSRFETFGIAILEAMASGKPIVATNVGNIPNLVQNGKNGIVVEPRPFKIANAVLVLFGDELLRRDISSNNLASARKYDWKEIIPKYLDMYYSLVRK
jgi:glycosyltransferase involved in cell wall biosynthesis